MTLRQRLSPALILALAAAAGQALAQPGAPDAKPAPKMKADGDAKPTDLIPRAAIFGNPDKVNPNLSPDGKRVAFIAPLEGVLNVWVAPVESPGAAKPVTRDTGRGITNYFWAYDNTRLLYTQDVGGDENWKVYSVDVTDPAGGVKDLTPFESIIGPDGKPIKVPNSDNLLRPSAQIEQVSHKFPGEILIGLNNRNPQYHDLYRVDIATGKMELIQGNDGYLGFMADDDYRVRFAMKPTPDGGHDLLIADGKGGFEPYMTFGKEDSLTTQPAGFSKDGRTMYMVDSRGRDTAALTAVDIASKEQKVLAEDRRADASAVIAHPVEKKPQAVGFNYERMEWRVLDDSIRGDLEYLKTVDRGDLSVDDRTLDDKHWVVTYRQDAGPVRFYHYDRDAKKATLLFSARRALEGLTLARMHPVVIKSRDGLNLVSYLTLPPWTDTDHDGRPGAALPMVLNVHGGPWARDNWGYHPEAQWLANRGYAVLQVNYRGSTGFGKEFINASNREWGGKMHADLIDAVNWAVKESVADPKKIAIYGGSYGGYATLVGMTFTPDVFACGVDIVGVSNLNTFMSTIPPYWVTFLDQLKLRVGDFTTEEGRAFLASRSPVNFVDRIKNPLLIAQGYNDPRVNHDESQQVVKAMQARNIPVTYVLYPDEGHGFARPENRMSFYAVAEAFLSEHLGGRFEPIGNDFEGSSITVPHGAEQVPGLKSALKE